MKIADPNPTVCSVCLQPPMIHDPQHRFVDFEVAYDGPVIPGSPANIPVDDLFICEDCLKRGAELIGMENGEEARAQIAQLEQTVAEKDTEITEKDKAIASLNATIAHLIDTGVIQRHPGKRPLTGPDSHAEQIAQFRKDRVARERSKRPKVKA